MQFVVFVVVVDAVDVDVVVIAVVAVDVSAVLSPQSSSSFTANLQVAKLKQQLIKIAPNGKEWNQKCILSES